MPKKKALDKQRKDFVRNSQANNLYLKDVVIPSPDSEASSFHSESDCEEAESFNKLKDFEPKFTLKNLKSKFH